MDKNDELNEVKTGTIPVVKGVSADSGNVNTSDDAKGENSEANQTNQQE